MAVMVFLPFCLKSCRSGDGGREREVFVEEGLHVCCCLGGGFVPEGTGFEFGEDFTLWLVFYLFYEDQMEEEYLADDQ
jgi:hypothetical protein